MIPELALKDSSGWKEVDSFSFEQIVDEIAHVNIAVSAV